MKEVLIVDDHPIVRRGLEEILRSECDLNLSEAANGTEARELMKQRTFDLIVLDLDLPGLVKVLSPFGSSGFGFGAFKSGDVPSHVPSAFCHARPSCLPGVQALRHRSTRT